LAALKALRKAVDELPAWPDGPEENSAVESVVNAVAELAALWAEDGEVR